MIYTAICGGIDPPRSDVTALGSNTRMNAKLYKILSHFWSDEITIWMDGNIFPVATETEIVNNLLGDADLALFKHPYRNSIREEGIEVVLTGKETKGKMDAILNHYGSRLDSLPLYEGGILIRRNTSAVKRFNETWLSLVLQWSIRDQLTCPIAVNESGVKISVIQGDLRKHPMFKYVPHQQ